MGNSIKAPSILKGAKSSEESKMKKVLKAGRKSKDAKQPSDSPTQGVAAANSSDRTIDTVNSTLTHSLHTKMPGEYKDRDIYQYYEVIKVLGVGSMGSVSAVKKKKAYVGGSARKKHQRKKQSSARNAMELFRGGTSKSRLRRSQSSGTLSELSAASARSVPSDENYEPGYAVKCIHLQRISDPKFVEELRNEIDILRSLDHPNIVRPIETFEQHGQLSVVMELCSGGDLYMRDPYTEQEAQKIVRKLLSAVAYMHRCGITHRDIKYENIMFENESPDAEIKLVDFGLSKKYLPDAPYMSDGVGTIHTMAPGVLEGEYTSQADLWSVGVVTFMLLASKMPFFGKKRREVYKKIMACQYSFEGRRWESISQEAKDFVTSLLQKDPDIRATAEEALKNPWLASNFFDTHKSAEVIRDTVQESLEKFSKYSKIKKLALMVVAHKSTTEEIGFLRDSFLKYDVKKDGTISYEEFKTALFNSGHSGYTDEELKDIFQGVDLDGSGLIHYTEFLAATLEAKGVIVEERLAEAFDRLDCDDSGYISRKNLRKLLAHGFQGRDLSESLISEIFAEGDFDKDGKISYDEFLRLWEKDEEHGREIIGEVKRTDLKLPNLLRSISSLGLKRVTTK